MSLSGPRVLWQLQALNAVFIAVSEGSGYRTSYSFND
jgi:hypothetical protein